MIGNDDSYYGRPEVSNSDLSALEKYFLPPQRVYDIQSAYRFGNLIDAMITEPARCDHYAYRVDSEQFTKAEWQQAYKMLEAFRADELCQLYHKMASGQNVMTTSLPFDYHGVKFEMAVRCKWDLWMEMLEHGSDIKSTTATSQSQFEAALDYFNYDKQRAFYMDIARAKGYKAEQDVLIGISKVNFKVFKIPIKRGGAIYESGREKYMRAGFQFWSLFDGF